MIIYKDEDTKVESIGDDIYRITSDASSDQPNSSDYVTVVLTIEELEGIYAAIIHYNAKREVDCCGNCKYWHENSSTCFRFPNTQEKYNCEYCGEHSRKE